ncbi:MAG: gamma-glutamyltransferase [Candidatus Aminicenantes bacterium]|nr:gamma-glutamyltransferase [Candidatus Aminicenantes bacterium]
MTLDMEDIMIKKACSVTKAGKIQRKFLAVLCMLSLAGPSFASTVDLSPKKWGAGELEIYNWLNKQFGLQNVLAEGKNGVIAGTTSASAERAGLEVLRQGGSAADAVLATSLAQITLAMGSWVSYAGIMTMVYFDAGSGRFYNLNAGFNTVAGEDDPETIPAQTNVLSPRPDAEIHPSGRTALVPGYMAGVQAAHKRFGKLPFKDLFAPAIYYAERGFKLTPFHGGLVKLRQKVLSRLPETKAVFTKPDGSWVAEGDLFKQPELAVTLRRIADRGADYMYTGEWGRKFVEAVRRDGGRMTMDDLEKYNVIWSDPLEISYGGYKIYAPGLPAQGGVHVAEALNVASQAGLSGMGHYSESARAFFWLNQITNLMVLSFMPEQTVSQLLGGADGSLAARTGVEHARRVWSLMSSGRFPLTKVPVSEEPRHSDAIVAIDRWGNVAAIVHTSNTAVWGTTGIFVDGVSVPDPAAFQQRLISQTGPGKRLPDPTEPLIIAKDGKPVAALSSIGAGLHQKTISVLLNLMDFDMSIKQAIDAPGLNSPKYEADGSNKPQVFERDFCGHLLAAVKKLGLEVAVVPNALTSTVPRGYVISGYAVGAAIDPKGGYKAVATDSLNGRALGY